MAKPVLKWAGGKTAILGEIEQRIAKIDTSEATFYDVFTGGASVALKFQDRFKKIVINDKNKELKHVYDAVKNEPVKLIEKLKYHTENHSHDYYYDIRKKDRQDEYNDLDYITKAARMIYLNKTCYNGLYRVNSKGHFNVPIGRQKKTTVYDEANVLEFSKVLKKITVLNADYKVAMSTCKKGDVVYIDPPYDKINKSSFVQYNAIAFDEFDQERLLFDINELTAKGVYVIASNSFTENTERLYKDYLDDNSIIFVKRSIASKNASRIPIREILIDNIEKVKKNVNKTSR